MSNTLSHAGIKGMKWGVRRFQNKDGSLTPAGKKRYGENPGDSADTHDDYKKARTAKSMATMSNKELRDVIERINLEKQYNQVTQKEKSAGEKFVTDVLLNASKQVATQYTATYMKKGVDALIKKVANKSK